jgi:hypothetical protein
MKAVTVEHVKPNLDVETFSFKSVKEAEDFVREAKKGFGWGVVYVNRATLQAHKGEIEGAIAMKQISIIDNMVRIFKGKREMYDAQWNRMVKSYGLESTMAHFEAQLKPFTGK